MATLKKGMAAAVLGLVINFGKNATPGIIKINNIILITVEKYIIKLLINYSHSIVDGGFPEMS
jgi:hypothetical protein